MAENKRRFFDDISGIISRPGATLGRLTEEKKWIPAFMLVMLAVMIFTYLFLPSQLEQMSRSQDMPEEYLRFAGGETSMLMRTMAAGFSAFMLFIGISVGAFFVYLFYGIAGSDGTYSNFFALVMNASIIDTFIPHIFNSVLLVWGVGSMNNLNIARLIPGLDPKSFTFLVLSRLELFSIWYILAIAAGAAVFSKMKLKKSLTVAIVYFLFKGLIFTLFSYLVLMILK